MVFMPDGIWGFVNIETPAPARRPDAAIRELVPLQVRSRAGGRCPVLGVEGFAKHFGGLKAVDGGDSRRRRRVHALIGPNGSGKTTTLNVVSGIYSPTAGRIQVRRQRRHRAGAA